MIVHVHLSDDGQLAWCPNWWRNFIYEEGICGEDAYNIVLEKYNARKITHTVIFENESAFTFFKLKFDGPTFNDVDWDNREIKIRSVY